MRFNPELSSSVVAVSAASWSVCACATLRHIHGCWLDATQHWSNCYGCITKCNASKMKFE